MEKETTSTDMTVAQVTVQRTRQTLSKHIVHHTLHSRSGIFQTISREEALAILKKWSTAIRHCKRGHRTIFLMHEKHGRIFDRMVIETRSHQMRRATEALADLKPEYSKSVELGSVTGTR